MADWFLEMLVNIADKTEVGVPVTLQVGGTLVSGTLASGKAYFEGIASLPFRKGEIEDELRKAFTDAGDAIPTSDEPPRYVHLRDAHIFSTNGTIPTHAGVWWRGRLSEVAGFWIGGLSKG
jgi:hypothetical protein